MIALAMAAMMATAAPTKIVDYDLGGLVGPRVREVEELQKSKTQVRILGPCASSCTYYLWLPNTCVGEDALLLFHETSLPMATEYIMEKYPPKIGRWIKAQGGLTKKVIVLRGREMKRLVPECR